MIGDRMVGLLSDLHKQHEQLLALSLKKTDALKANEMKALDQILTQENKCIQQIDTIENARVQEVEFLLNHKGIVADENPSLAQLLRFYKEEEQQTLLEVQAELRETIQKLQEQNELNHELTRQSLQFVNASLSLMEPKQPSANYGRPGQSTKPNGYKKQQSIFDSKA